MGVALMDARNKLFHDKDTAHSLIVNTKDLLAAAHKERQEVDTLLGGPDNTKGQTITNLRYMVKEALKRDAQPASPRLGK